MLPEAERYVMNLAHVLTHRIRNRLACVEGFASLLLETLETDDQREMMLRLLEAATGIEEVLADLQRFSEPIVPLLQRVRLGEVVATVLAALEAEEQARVALHDEAALGASVVADPLLLAQALLALVRNGLEAQPGGAVRLSFAIDVARRQVVGALWSPAGCAAAEVAFEPFFTTKASNLGIGLFLARRSLEVQGGSLSLLPAELDGGTAFRVVLPLGDGVFPVAC